jgi:phosphoenolpyruvate-protein phosphotransferase
MSGAATGGSITLLAPLAGWSTPLDEVPDEVFAARMLGEGVAIDPTAGTLYAPCDGELLLVAASRHAVTVRTPEGCEVLVHVGIDTVGLAGEGFQVHATQGSHVRAGDALLSFDLDLLAQRARSLLTPVVVTADHGFRVLRQTLDRAVAVGDFLMEVGVASGPAPGAGSFTAAAAGAAAPLLTRRLAVQLKHGIHARPAALLAASIRNLDADVRVAAHGKQANARSTVALMSLGVQHGDEIEIRASGPDASAAAGALAGVLATAGDVSGTAIAAQRAPAAPTSVSTAAPATAGRLPGVVASPGVAVGEARQLRRLEPEVRETGADIKTETAQLERARASVRVQLTRAAQGPAAAGNEAAREIAAAHLELLEDPELLDGAHTLLNLGKSAGFAWRSTLRAAGETLRQLPDPRLRERADDLTDLESQVLAALTGGTGGVPALPPHAIVIAQELLPSQLLALDAAQIAGIALAAGGATSHVAIIAAAKGIPTLVALGPAVLAVPDGTPVVLDAGRGLLEIGPEPERLERARAAVAVFTASRAGELAAAQRECRTADGIRIEVLANIGSLAEVEAAVKNGAEGCGLLRTEFLFLDRQSPPSEAEQSAAYAAIAAALGSRPLTIRTLDAGGDKPIAYLPLPPEENPALGLRGVRTGLAYPQLLRTQLRAVLALRERSRCRLLLPMITDMSDLLAVRAVLDEVRKELGGEDIKVGVMIETPASALLAESLAEAADFLSIGTNDLTQYTLAMDRGHPQLAARLDALHPAVLRLIARTAAAAGARGRHCAVCGGLASEPLAAPLLVGLGVNELSAVAAVIPRLKARIGGFTMAECGDIARQALEADSAAAVRELLVRELTRSGVIP